MAQLQFCTCYNDGKHGNCLQKLSLLFLLSFGKVLKLPLASCQNCPWKGQLVLCIIFWFLDLGVLD